VVVLVPEGTLEEAVLEAIGLLLLESHLVEEQAPNRQ
jgi:hypothetical protein